MEKIPYNENNAKENLSETKRQKENKIVVIGILEGMSMLAFIDGMDIEIKSIDKVIAEKAAQIRAE